MKLKQKKFAPATALEEAKKVTEPIEEVKEDEEDFEHAFEKQYEQMLEEDIEQNLQCDSTPESLEESATAEYNRTKEQLKQFLNMESPSSPGKGKTPSKEGEVCLDELDDESEEYYHRFKTDGTGFEKKYDELVDIFSDLSRKKNLDEEGKSIEKCIALAKYLMKDWNTQTDAIKTKCPRETLLKGLLFLMNARSTELLLDLCECGIIVFLSLYSSYKAAVERPPDFYFVFNSLLNVVKIVYKCSKEATNDALFRKKAVLDETVSITELFVQKEERATFIRSASKLLETSMVSITSTTGTTSSASTTTTTAKNVVVKNENNAYELLLFMLGTYKNLSIAKENRSSMVDKGILVTMLNLLKSLIKAEDELKDKLPQCLVQITGTVRNLLGDTDGVLVSTLKDIISILRTYYASHSELSLNCLRILSKASLNVEYAAEIVKSGCSEFLIELLKGSVDHPFVFVRIAFILGNATMLFGTQCEELYKDPKAFDVVYNAMAFYLDLWKQKESGKALDLKAKGVKNIEDFVKHFNNDVVVKATRLCANLWISEDLAKRELARITPETFESLMGMLEVELNDANEDLLLNALSCLSNILFFFPTVNKEFSERLLKKCKSIFSVTSNNEIRIECLRIWANLSRDPSSVSSFVENRIIDAVFETLTGLKTEQRELFYSIGVLINLSGSETVRKELYGPRIGILLQKLGTAGLEDPELSKNLCKLLVNLCDKKEGENKWSNEQLEKVDKILGTLCEECDSLLDVANEKEKEILNDLHKLMNNLINVLPELMFNCPIQDCGRKFKVAEELAQHVSRRHNKSAAAESKK